MSLHTVRLYLDPNPDGVYTVTGPYVPGLVTQGQTPAEVQANVQEVLDALVESSAELGRDLSPALRPVLADRPRRSGRGKGQAVVSL
jgi:predicted RNase H-like HicB family nuclease